jgi:hypothetical protein
MTKRGPRRSSTYHRGHLAEYLAARIVSNRREILDRMIAGEYRSVQKEAIDADIVQDPDPEDRRYLALVEAWRRADLVDRQIFLEVMEEEIEAAQAGEYLQLEEPAQKGPGYWDPGEGADLESLFRSGVSVSEVVRQLGVGYRTVAGWRYGRAKPGLEILNKLAEMAKEIEKSRNPGDIG